MGARHADYMTRFRGTFFQEADEHLGEMESGLLRLERNPGPDLLNAIFREPTSSKGRAAVSGSTK